MNEQRSEGHSESSPDALGIGRTMSTEKARRYYNLLGARYDWVASFERRAKARAIELLDLKPGQRVLDVGVGTGKEHAQLQVGVTPGGIAFGLDVSPVMLALTKSLTGSPVVTADARSIPFADASFDRLFAAYVLDLICSSDLPTVLADFRRVLKPGGRMVLLALTEGVTPATRTLVALWKAVYTISPLILGGCRPLQLTPSVQWAGFGDVRREVIVQMAVPSEIVVGTRR